MYCKYSQEIYLLSLLLLKATINLGNLNILIKAEPSITEKLAEIKSHSLTPFLSIVVVMCMGEWIS